MDDLVLSRSTLCMCMYMCINEYVCGWLCLCMYEWVFVYGGVCMCICTYVYLNMNTRGQLWVLFRCFPPLHYFFFYKTGCHVTPVSL